MLPRPLSGESLGSPSASVPARFGWAAPAIPPEAVGRHHAWVETFGPDHEPNRRDGLVAAGARPVRTALPPPVMLVPILAHQSDADQLPVRASSLHEYDKDRFGERGSKTALRTERSDRRNLCLWPGNFCRREKSQVISGIHADQHCLNPRRVGPGHSIVHDAHFWIEVCPISFSSPAYTRSLLAQHKNV
jgi:hypothetical protein